MPSVNLSPETYEKLRERAAQEGRSPDAVAEEALTDRLGGVQAPDPALWAVKLDEALRKTQDELTDEDAGVVAVAAVKEMRAEQRARKLPREERLAAFRSALEEVRAGIPADLDPAELQSEIDAAIAEVRADRRARGN